jgi:hypothetical protein
MALSQKKEVHCQPLSERAGGGALAIRGAALSAVSSPRPSHDAIKPRLVCALRRRSGRRALCSHQGHRGRRRTRPSRGRAATPLTARCGLSGSSLGPQVASRVARTARLCQSHSLTSCACWRWCPPAFCGSRMEVTGHRHRCTGDGGRWAGAPRVRALARALRRTLEWRCDGGARRWWGLLVLLRSAQAKPF